MQNTRKRNTCAPLNENKKHNKMNKVKAELDRRIKHHERIISKFTGSGYTKPGSMQIRG